MHLAHTVRRPLVGITLVVATGMGMDHVFSLHPALALGVCGVFLALALWWRSSILLYLICAWLAIAHAGSDRLTRQTHLQTLANTEEPVEFCATVLEDLSSGGGRPRLRLQTSALHPGTGWIPARLTLQAELPEGLDPILPGHVLWLQGSTSPSRHSTGQIDGWLRIEDPCAIRQKAPPPAYRTALHHVRNLAAAQLAKGAAPDSLHPPLLSALLLGLRQHIPESLHPLFSKTGTMHIFAISGLHVGVMASILIAILKTAGVSRNQWGLFLIPALLVYVASTGMRPSALRAFSMIAICFAAPLFGRRHDLPSAIALPALWMLTANPRHISDPGFLLSFTVVCGIVMVHGQADHFLAVWREEEPRRTWRILSPRSPAEPLFRWMTALAITSLAAWLFSMPLSARFFSILSPVALFGNLLVIPLTFLIVLTGCLTIWLGLLWSAAAVFLNGANGLFISVLLAWIERGASLPGAWFAVPAPPAWMLILWYSGWIALLLNPRRLYTPAAACIALSLLPWALAARPATDALTVQRIGHHALALRIPESGWILISTGDARYAEQTIRRMQQQGVQHIHALSIVGENADPVTIERFANRFHPREMRTVQRNDPVSWPAGNGSINIHL